MQIAMKQNRKRWALAGGLLLFVALIGGCLTISPRVEIDLARFNVDIFRGVDANPNNGRATLSPSQFNFNPDLSTYINPILAPVQKACNYRFTVQNVPNNPPMVGDTGTIQGLEGYSATFNNVPPGHWQVLPPNGTTSASAKAAVSAFAQNNRGGVVNGTLQGCN